LASLAYKSHVVAQGGKFHPRAVIDTSSSNMKSTVAFTLATALAALGATASKTTAPGQLKKEPMTGPNGEPYVPGKWFDRYFMIIGENMDFWEVEAQSTFADLWKKGPNGRLLANYYGVTHPSQVGRMRPARSNTCK
jgi:hypothetical protein